MVLPVLRRKHFKCCIRYWKVSLFLLLLLCFICSGYFFTSSKPLSNEKWCIWPTHPLERLIREGSNTSHFPLVHSAFERYDDKRTGIPAWIISTLSNKNRLQSTSTVHRFFDSSPFSPSARYVALTRMPFALHSAAVQPKAASVVIIDLVNGEEHVIANTSAWGAQVGAHVQWGASDTQLFFNDALVDRIDSTSPAHGTVHGVLYNFLARSAGKILPCPVYHVSPDGRFTAAPSLHKIKQTQFGYGADYLPGIASLAINVNASQTDGLFVNDVEKRKCTLVVSLYDFAVAAGLDTRSTPTYGFHAKWSGDGSRILFVMRTLERASGFKGSVLGHRVRRQHLFVLLADGSRVRHIVSWGSMLHQGGSDPGIDGNHPNWIRGSHKVSMNIKPMGQRAPWRLVEFDTDQLVRSDISMSSSSYIHSILTEAFSPSSGHPTFLSGGRFALIDVYAKEIDAFGSYGSYRANITSINGMKPTVMKPSTTKFAPLRLVDTRDKREVWLLEVQLIPDDIPAAALEMIRRAAKKEIRAWRCDMHAAFSNDGNWVAFNGRPHGTNREVIIAHIGHDIGRYFGT